MMYNKGMNILGFDKYKILPDGRVYSKTTSKYLKPHLRGRYYQYRLYANDGSQHAFSVHRLVALHFLPNPDEKPQVNHKDGNRANNHLNNLEWVTGSENVMHSRNVLKNKVNTSGIGKSGKLNGKSKPVTNGVKVYESANQATKDGFWSSAISLCCNGKLKTHGGYQWSFVEEN